MVDARPATSFLPKTLAVEEDQDSIQAHAHTVVCLWARPNLHGPETLEPEVNDRRDRLKLTDPGDQSLACLSRFNRVFAGTKRKPSRPFLGATVILQPLHVLLVLGTLDT